MTSLTYELTIGFETNDSVVHDAVAAWLEARGLAYAQSVMGELTLLVYASESAALDAIEASLAADFPRQLAISRAALPDDTWLSAWDNGFERLESALFVVGTRQRLEATAGKMEIVLAPGKAFGQGDHATTHACLRALEALEAAGAMLDVGTGTGVLAIAAARLGYSPVVGTDIDEEIVSEARENAARNAVDVDFLCTEVIPSQRFGLVAANIPAPALHQLLPQLCAAVAKGGALILSGFIDKECDALVKRARCFGLVEEARIAVRGWSGLTLRCMHRAAFQTNG